ncbi:arginase, hepatic-like [Penaeus chinensis]|uniref:arginase, hepatic-like n=1 Tax=Penaeus chinensis TaxID=139456 RepID=UPI001FB6C33C|nr:arginase, hepatic-like [Penaeus chinensis]
MLRSFARQILRRDLVSFPQLLRRAELHVGVIGAPFNKGQRRMGVKDGPSVIKDTGFLDDLRNLGVDVTDYGSVKLPHPEDNEAGPSGERWHKTVLEYNRLLANSVNKALKETDLCLTLGGDHSIAIGTINGHSQVNPDHQVRDLLCIFHWRKFLVLILKSIFFFFFVKSMLLYYIDVLYEKDVFFVKQVLYCTEVYKIVFIIMKFYLKKYGRVDVTDYGSVKLPHPEDNEAGPSGERWHKTVLEYNRLLANSVNKALKETDLCLTLGGDHSIAIGTINGHRVDVTDYGSVKLPHPEDNEAGPSGERWHKTVLEYNRLLANSVNKALKETDLCLTLGGDHSIAIGTINGHSQVNPDHQFNPRRIIKDMGIQAFWASDVERVGLSAVLGMCMEHLQPSEKRPLHISFDIDALDPVEAPSTGTPVRGGLTLREGLNIVEVARATGHLRAFDMVEVNPDLGNQNDANLTSQAARLVILSALAGYRGA